MGQLLQFPNRCVECGGKGWYGIPCPRCGEVQLTGCQTIAAAMADMKLEDFYNEIKRGGDDEVCESTPS